MRLRMNRAWSTKQGIRMGRQFHILYHDEHLVAVSKPPGLLVHKTNVAGDRATVMNLLRNQLDTWVYPIHRLDRNTTGVLLFGLNRYMASALGELFQERTVEKNYVAVARGWTAEAGVVDEPLENPSTEKAQDAETAYRRLATVELDHAVRPFATARYSLVAVTPATGRWHQIRRHLARTSHPVIGDSVHGDTHHNRLVRDTLGFRGLLLHAARLRLPHPALGEELTIDCPLAKNLWGFCRHCGWEEAVPEVWRRR